MGPVSGTVVYFLTWWITFLCVLPYKEDPQVERVPGTFKSSPENPLIRQKIIATCLIAAVLWAVIDYLIYVRVIDFREMAAQMPLL
jgi:predicted secreted protein